MFDLGSSVPGAGPLKIEPVCLGCGKLKPRSASDLRRDSQADADFFQFTPKILPKNRRLRRAKTNTKYHTTCFSAQIFAPAAHYIFSNLNLLVKNISIYRFVNFLTFQFIITFLLILVNAISIYRIDSFQITVDFDSL